MKPLILFVVNQDLWHSILFTDDKAFQKKSPEIVRAGSVCINDTLVHVGQGDLPFGGIGPSGMGHYHGREGFLTFSHAKAVHKKGRFNSGMFGYPHMRPKLLDKLLDWLLKP
ncbi:MAG: aldehyde dehydrogenase family protein [Rheinheimera sp.]|nr:aldehyde dehydrogenase family protein [Rheinheimera sp.]